MLILFLIAFFSYFGLLHLYGITGNVFVEFVQDSTTDGRTVDGISLSYYETNFENYICTWPKVDIIVLCVE